MRIALVLPGGVDRTGRERVIPVVLSLIERLARRHQVTVVAVEHEPQWCQYPLLGATVINLGRVSGVGRAVQWAVRFRRLIAALRSQGGHFDVLHALWVGTPASLAVAAGRWLGIPVVASIGGGELVWLPEIGYGGQGSWAGRLKTSLILRKADALSAGSQYCMRPLVKIRPDTVWLPWGVDWKLFDAPVERPAGPPWRLLHVASINRVKDQVTLLQAARLVLDYGKAIRLDCIGQDTLAGSVQQAAIELNLGNAVKFHGFKTTDAVAPFYRLAHLYVHSSLHESMAAVVLEAAAAGVPTVGTAVGLIAEMAPEAALAVPVRDPPALADGIVSLLESDDRRYRMGRAAQRFARAYDADWTAAQFEAVYSRLSIRQ
jgi:glycosyltransferase involved in cell wall biosynthesis